jgi:hypothetical protein
MNEGMTAFLDMIAGIFSIPLVHELVYFILAAAVFGLFVPIGELHMKRLKRFFLRFFVSQRKKYRQSRGFLWHFKECFKRAFTRQPEIHTYFGLTGSGKTTVAVAMMHKLYKKHKKRGITIYTNVDCSLPFVTKITKDDLIDGQLTDGFVFYDEASLDFNNREFKKFTKASQNFFRYHRKNRLHVNVFSQAPEDTDKVIRDLSHCLYRIEKRFLFVFVKCIGRRIGVDEMSKDIKTIHKLAPAFIVKIYCWLYWSFKFDTYKRTVKEPTVCPSPRELIDPDS